MLSIFKSEYFEVNKNGISPFQTMIAYLGGSAFQTIIDNPVSVKEVVIDSKKFGMRCVFRGQGLGMAKAIISLSMFHEGRMYLINYFKNSNAGHDISNNEFPKKK